MNTYNPVRAINTLTLGKLYTVKDSPEGDFTARYMGSRDGIALFEISLVETIAMSARDLNAAMEQGSIHIYARD